MNAFTPRDYQLNKEYRKSITSQSSQDHLANLVAKKSGKSFSTPKMSQLMIYAVLVFALVILFVILPAKVDAQSVFRPEADASISSPVQHALIMGAYYYNHERYEEAVAQFETAIEQMPPELFELMPEQSIVFWQLGEALEQAGYLNEALDCYEQYLQFAGKGATETAVAYVEGLKGNVEQVNA